MADESGFVEHSSFNDEFSDTAVNNKSQAWASFADNGASSSTFRRILTNRAALDPPLLTTFSSYSLMDAATPGVPQLRRFDFDFWGSDADEMSRVFDIKSSESFANFAAAVRQRRHAQYVQENFAIFDDIFAEVLSSSISWPTAESFSFLPEVVGLVPSAESHSAMEIGVDSGHATPDQVLQEVLNLEDQTFDFNIYYDYSTWSVYTAVDAGYTFDELDWEPEPVQMVPLGPFGAAARGYDVDPRNFFGFADEWDEWQFTFFNDRYADP